MSLIVPSLVTNSKGQHPFLVLQSSLAQSSLDILRAMIESARARNGSRILICLLYPPSSLLGRDQPSGDSCAIVDLTQNVPEYSDSWLDPCDQIKQALNDVPAGPVDLVIDSLDTLSTDTGSTAQTAAFVSELLSLVKSRTQPSRLVVHVLSPSPLLPLLESTAMSPSLVHLTAHSPTLLQHIASAYLTPPPPLSAPTKFWGVFIPLSERLYEAERLVYGPDGEGSGGQEFVVEAIVRHGSGARRGVERVLEGWTVSEGPCALAELKCMKSLFSKPDSHEAAPDPTQNVSFNLNLTPSQQESRAQVPLPYTHEGKPLGHAQPGAIFYDPDSADDLDDDDPDEDLDI